MVWVLSRAEGDAEVYFMSTDKFGRTRWSVFWADAARFSTARAAVECAMTHPELRNSDRWRVVQITDRCERTR